MLRVVSALCADGTALELLALGRRDRVAAVAALRGVSSRALRSRPPEQLAASQEQIVLSSTSTPTITVSAKEERGTPSAPPPAPPPPPAHSQRVWMAAAAVALTASVGGGVYLYRKLSAEDTAPTEPAGGAAGPGVGGAAPVEPPVPARGEAFPAHVHYLVVGGGTAAFAAMRALRAARPTCRVLLVSEERALPYMRPPISKELWREPDLAERALHPDTLTFRQWNGRRRSVVYEPAAFYTPVERLADEPTGGTAVAQGWRVTRLDVARHEAELVAPGQPPRVVSYEKCLVATGVRARRVEALREAAAAGRSLALRGLRDAAQLAAALDKPHVRNVAIIGGGFLATELSAALADRLGETGKRVVQVVAELAPMAAVLPPYLAEDTARRLRESGVMLVTGAEVAAAELTERGVRLRLSGPGGEEPQSLEADVVVECVGAEPEGALAAASGLETHPELGGVVVNAELQARADVYAAGDAACFYDVALGRRRVEHHDHAVVSGRLAGENMAALGPPKHYSHQSMFWSDLGPQLGYEAIGIIDSRLPTVGVFSADAVHRDRLEVGAVPAGASGAPPPQPVEVAGGDVAATAAAAAAARYDRGVVFYLRERRVVGVLLWNLFNRMHVARQVMAQGEFADLFEVAKLFAPHERD